jgi:hypothetical protein
MKKISTLILLFIFTKTFGQTIGQEVLNYHNGCVYPENFAGVVVKTKFPFATHIMGNIILEGYNYGRGENIDWKINYYTYQNTGSSPFYFYQSSISTAGAYNPEIKLFNDGGSISIFIPKGDLTQYCINFKVRAWNNFSVNDPTWYQNWSANISANDPTLSLAETDKTTCVYKNNFMGNVGIGLTSPLHKLDVNGSTRTIGTHHITHNYDGNARLVFSPSNGAGNTWEHYPQTNGYGLYDRTNNIYRYFIDNNGNFGIGTANPSALLNIHGGHSNTKIRLTLPTSANSGNTGDIHLQTWVSEPNHTWDGGGIGMNVDNLSNFPRINNAIGQSFIRFLPNGGSMSFNTANSSGTQFIPLFLKEARVGIGTDSPKNVLDLGEGTGNRGISWGGNAGNYANIWTKWSNANLVLSTGLAPNGQTPAFESSYGDAGMGKAAIELGAYENGGDIMFYGNAPSAVTAGTVYTPTERMRIKANGNVGIGNINPNAKLEISSTPNVTNFRATGNNARLIVDYESGGDNYYEANQHIFRKFLGSEVMRIDGNNSNVGIGTASPDTKFHIKGDGNPTLKLEGTNIPSIHFKSAFGQTLINNYNDGSFRINNEYNSAATHFVINAGGNIGMGTANIPTGYKLAVGGNIIAEKVKVKKRDASGNWPDYVFAPSYKLPSLSEVESYVKQNSHLPEIPSAKEIEAEGQDLGDMNRLLLKKVEELTLYLIEKNKEIKTLKSKVEQLEKK